MREIAPHSETGHSKGPPGEETDIHHKMDTFLWRQREGWRKLLPLRSSLTSGVGTPHLQRAEAEGNAHDARFWNPLSGTIHRIQEALGRDPGERSAMGTAPLRDMTVNDRGQAGRSAYTSRRK